VRAIYLAHAAGAERRYNPIRSKLLAQKGCGDRLRDRRVAHCGCLEETPGFSFPRQQQFDLTEKFGVSGAFNVEECLPRF
jgi:hypothetical protein